MQQKTTGAAASALMAVATTAVLASCSGSGGSSTAAVGGLNVPAQVSLVDATGSGSQNSILRARAAAEDLPDGVLSSVGTFDDDPTQFWVRDDSMEALDTVNVILESIRQTRFDAPSVLNAGPYVALVSSSDRDSGGGNAGRAGQQYERFVVDSSRASATAPHVVRFWIEQSDNGNPAILYGRLTITESPSVDLPYGNFELQFKQLLPNQSPDDPNVRFWGFLRTVPRDDGQAEFEFMNVMGDVDGTVSPGDFAFRHVARLVASADGTAGQAYSENKSAYDSGSGTVQEGAEYFLEYDRDYLARKKVESGSTINVFDRNDFTTKVYRYGVYDATTGAGINRVSGFGLQTAGGEYGWVGYHGLWFPDFVTITDGQQLTRPSFDQNSAPRTYTAVVIPGRLEKRERVTLTFADLVDEDMEYFDPSNGQQMLVRWTGTDLVRVGTPNGSGGWDPVSPPVSISGSFSTDDWVDLYSRARGQVQFLWPSGGLSNAVEAYVWTQETINGSSPEAAADFQLYGYHQMLKPLLTSNQANFQNSETPFYPMATGVNSGNRTYTFDVGTLMLEEAGQQIRLGDGVTVTQGPGQFGFQCGPLFSSPLTTFGEMSTRTVQYQWSTGTNSWNQLRTVRDGQGNFIEFDEPLRLQYTHSEAGSPYDGRTFILEWNGNDLNGIPFVEVPGQNYWEPAFNIPTGATATLMGTSTVYRIKALEGEQTMNAVGDPNAVITSQGFDLDTTLTPPTNRYTDPAIGAMPDLDVPPRFVAGEAQGDG